MSDLTVIVPSRGRPEAVAELGAAFVDTCTAATLLEIVVDESDPARNAYLEAVTGVPVRCRLTITPSTSMVQALNLAANGLETPAVAFMGDDHRPRTPGWDGRYLEQLRDLGTGMVYGDDGWQHEKLPTQIAMTSDIVQVLGWMAPPDLVHMYVDNWWMELGQRAGCIRYLPDVLVEHVHPVTGKVPWDEGHVRVNQPSMYHRDEATMARLRALDLPRAVQKIRALRGAV